MLRRRQTSSTLYLQADESLWSLELMLLYFFFKALQEGESPNLPPWLFLVKQYKLNHINKHSWTVKTNRILKVQSTLIQVDVQVIALNRNLTFKFTHAQAHQGEATVLAHSVFKEKIVAHDIEETVCV